MDRSAAPALLTALLLGWAFSGPGVSRADVILVVDTASDTVADDGLCSLREAITAANADANASGCLGSGGGFDRIEFALGGGTPLIQLTSQLPSITRPVAIDGGAGRVEIRGTGGGSGLFITGAEAAGTSIGRLVLNGFNAAIFVEGTTNVTIAGNFIGTDATGSLARPNNFGIRVASSSVRIGGTSGWLPGGTCTGDCNLISGNTLQAVDVGLGLNAASSAVVQGNVIGADAAGTAALGNGTGILLEDAQATIGGAVAGGGNLISGNGVGVSIVRSADFPIATFVQGNRIGSDTGGAAAIPNGTGILVDLDNQEHPVVIGGATALARNLISGNSGSGIRLQLADFVTIQGNRIGTRANGTDPLPNGGPGVELLSSSHDNVIGGVGSGEGNVIAYNATGVSIGPFDFFNTVRGNSIRDNVGQGIALADDQMGTTATPTITGALPVSGTACPGCVVDVYSDASDEGGIYEGSTTADGIGGWTFVGPVEGPNVTATATSAQGSTSEFSAPVPEPGAGVQLAVAWLALAGVACRRRARRRRIAIAACAGLVAAPLAAHAVASLDAGARVCLGSVANCSIVGPGEGGGGAVFTGATGVGASTSAGTPPGSSPFLEASAGAAQDYGVFRGRAQVIVDTPYSSAGSFWGGSATGLATDTWTITAAGRSGAGQLVAYFTARGSFAASAGNGGVVQGALRIAVELDDSGFAGSTGPIVESGTYGFESDTRLAFAFGVPFKIETTANVDVSIAAPPAGGPLSGAALIDFSRAAYLSAVEIYDAQGQPVPDAVIAAESNAAYFVPEPHGNAAGAIALAALARRRRRGGA